MSGITVSNNLGGNDILNVFKKLIFNSHWRHFIAVKFHWSVVHFRHRLDLNMIPMQMILSLSVDIICYVFCDELCEIFSVLVDVVASLLSYNVVHFLVAVKLVRNCAE